MVNLQLQLLKVAFHAVFELSRIFYEGRQYTPKLADFGIREKG
jgi:hypothetical protein